MSPRLHSCPLESCFTIPDTVFSACRRSSGQQSFWTQFPNFDYRIAVARKALPLSIIFVGMITFNNICLQYVEVSFYNVARSLTIVFNVAITYLVLHETTSLRTCLTLLVVVAGFVVSELTWYHCYYEHMVV